MTDQDAYGQPTRADLPPVEPTRATPATAGGPPRGRPPRPTAGPPSGGGDRRGWILGGLVALILVLGVATLLVSSDDDTNEATGDTTTTTVEDTTTTSSSTTTTVEATTTTEEEDDDATTTTEATRSTVAPDRCDAMDSDDPGAGVEVLFEAYQLDDRVCAYQLGTVKAVDKLFAIPGRGAGWNYQGCAPGEDTDPFIECAYTHDGGATYFRTSYSDAEGWQVFEVYGVAD